MNIYEADIDRVESLTQANLSHALCTFNPEVMKVKEGASYPGPTLYQLVMAIQRYLNKNGLNWKLLDSNQFINVRTVPR